MSEVADDDAVARFAGRYAGTLDPRNAVRWAVDPFAPAMDGSPSPAVLLEERRRALYRTRADADEVARFTADLDAWQRELSLARDALPDREAEPAPPTGPDRLPRRPRLAAVAVAIGVPAVVAI
ncbi:hypothetical protein, partial [Amnibacterium sp.]|uniref:hypothetical protein n=1 Tax=Amnibacterium sp. TaxID=1872496 RepID=UPI0026336C91